MSPRARLRVACALAGLLGACQSRDQPAEAPAAEARPTAEVVSRIARLQEEEGDVLARRDELTRARQKVSAERAALEERRKAVAAAGGDLKPVDDEERALAQREANLVADERDLAKKLDGLIAGYQEVTSGASAGREVVVREAQVAVREKDFGRREKALADREATLAERERELARREKDTCSVTPTVVQAPAPAPAAGTRYTRRDVEPLLTAARRRMSDKGLLPADLPAPARVLEREANSALSGGDFGRARLAADQLVATIESLKVDRGFIVAKINRLNGSRKTARLSGDAKKEADDLFRDATADYGDGKFAAANGKLNRIFVLVE